MITQFFTNEDVPLIRKWHKASDFFKYVNLSEIYITSDLWGECLSNMLNFSKKAENSDLRLWV